MDGSLIELIDKRDGTSRLTGKAQLLLADTQANDTSAWRIGRWTGLHALETTLVQKGGNAVLQTLEIHQQLRSSKLQMTVSLAAGAKALKLQLKVDWNEISHSGESIPLLLYNAPIAASGLVRMDVPGGVVDRSAEPVDKPGLTFAASVTDDRAVLLASDCKYGYRCDDQGLSLSLINSAHNPDPYPERGMHVINLWLGVSDAHPLTLKNMARGFCHPAMVCSTGLHTGALPPVGSLAGFESSSSFLSALYEEDGCTFARVTELCGETDTVRLCLPGVSAAELVDGLGRTLGTAAVQDGCVCVTVKPYGIVTVKMH